MSVRQPLLALCLAAAGALPAFAADTAMAGAFRAACVDAAGNLGAVAQAWAGLAGVAVADMVIEKHPEQGFLYVYSALDHVAGANGDERFTLNARAPGAEDAVTYCMISNDATLSPDAQLAALVETMGLVPDAAAPLRPLSEGEVKLGIDARGGEQLWTSPHLPGAQIRTDLTPADAAAGANSGANTGSDTGSENPLAMPLLKSPFGSVYFEISYDPALAS